MFIVSKNEVKDTGHGYTPYTLADELIKTEHFEEALQFFKSKAEGFEVSEKTHRYATSYTLYAQEEEDDEPIELYHVFIKQN